MRQPAPPLPPPDETQLKPARADRREVSAKLECTPNTVTLYFGPVDALLFPRALAEFFARQILGLPEPGGQSPAAVAAQTVSKAYGGQP